MEFPWDSFDPVQHAIDEGVAAGKDAIRAAEAHLGERVNGSQMAFDIGRYGTKDAYWAAWTFFDAGGNLIEDACYPLAVTDGTAEPSTGAAAAIRTRTATLRGRILVLDHVRRRELPDRQRARPVRAW